MSEASPSTTVCRTIMLEIEEADRWGGSRGGSIKTEPPPRALDKVEAFLAQVLPDKRIERIGRTDLLKLSKYRGPQPSDLFYQAVHACFSGHHALTIRPEVLMHLIVGEVATTVNRHPEAYRSLFSASDKKERIDVRHDGLELGNPESPWHEVLALFDGALRERVPAGIMEHLLPPFSTATPETRAASLVAFMDAAQKFYDYHTHTMCGIPEVRLAGAPEDYHRVLNAAAQLAEPFWEHLGRYFDYLLPVLQTIADQAAGAPVDESFWKSIYKFDSQSGSDLFNGWITAFINYVQTAEIKGSQYNEAKQGGLIAKPDDLYDWTDCQGRYSLKGLDLGSVPAHVSTAPFIWHYFGEEKKMLFAGGVLGIDDYEGSVMPTLSYAVLHDE